MSNDNDLEGARWRRSIRCLRRLMYPARFLLIILSIVLVALEIAQILTGHQVGEQKFAAIAAMLAWAIALSTAADDSGVSGTASELMY